MVTIVPPKYNIGSQIGENIAQGLQIGAQGHLQNLQKMLQAQQTQKMLDAILGGSDQSQQSPQNPNTSPQTSSPGTSPQQGIERLSDDQLERMLVIPQMRPLVEFELSKRQKEKEVGATRDFQREESLYKSNLPLFNDIRKKQAAAESELSSIKHLQAINESGKLPEGLQRWNVDLSTGELRLPFLANKETQDFVKTINDFTVKAKDSYGGRVTNFELDRFMKRLPTLLNTPDGRSSILRQMEIVGQINELENRYQLDAIKEAGGIRKIDFDKVDEIAREKSAKEVERLRKEYGRLEKFSDSLQDNGGKKPQEAKNAVRNVPPGTKITVDIVDQLLREANNDPAKAQQMAKELGYEF